MKHTDAPTISQGLKRYLRTCSTSGLASVRARGEQLASMSKGERMAAYKAEFGSNWAGTKAAPNAPKGGSMSIEAAVEALRAAGIEVTLPATEVVEDAPKGRTFKKGTRFSFEAQNGNVREHTVERVKDGRVYTDQGQDFSIEKALNGYAADRVVIL